MLNFIKMTSMEQNNMKNIAVILAGCGVFDGSEINEVVLTLLHIEKTTRNISVLHPILRSTILLITLLVKKWQSRVMY